MGLTRCYKTEVFLHLYNSEATESRSPDGETKTKSPDGNSYSRYIQGVRQCSKPLRLSGVESITNPKTFYAMRLGSQGIKLFSEISG